jgi:hypothetical protein
MSKEYDDSKYLRDSEKEKNFAKRVLLFGDDA